MGGKKERKKKRSNKEELSGAMALRQGSNVDRPGVNERTRERVRGRNNNVLGKEKRRKES